MENVQNWSSGCKAMPSSFTTKAYTQLGSVPRAAETTINNVAVFQSYRAKQGGPSDELKGRSESFPPRRRKRGPLLFLLRRFPYDFGGGWSGALRPACGARLRRSGKTLP